MNIDISTLGSWKLNGILHNGRNIDILKDMEILPT